MGGYYTVDGCDGVQPTLGLEKDVTYTFVQSDISNYYHPLGLAYYTDGAHADVDELEPGIVPPGSTSSCGDDNTCPAPMYRRDDTYLGVYSNNDQITSVVGNEDFGLDVYEPEFFATSVDWASAGTYKVSLKFDVADFLDDIFYFCHIHSGMSGRIKWVDGPTGDKLQPENTPDLAYEYEVQSAFDEECGTYGIGNYQLPHAECPSDFVCDSELPFAGCVEAINCRMTVGMTTNMNAGSAKALFIHQMIPHHRNAVNMAKALLESGELDCDDYTSETADCALEQIAREIIPVQNHQIQGMQGVLDELGYASEDDCKVIIDTTGSFQIVNRLNSKCVTESSWGRAILATCGGDKQTWTSLATGGIQNVETENCLFVKSPKDKIKVGECKAGTNRVVTKSAEGTLEMQAGVWRPGMVLTPANSGNNKLSLAERVVGESQEFDYNYL